MATAHRGFHNDSITENTLEAFIEASKRGFKFSECDVRLSKDGILVIIHDTTFKRVAKNPKNVAASTKISEMNWSSIKRIPLKNNEKIPRLIDALHVAKKYRFKLIVEIKGGKKAGIAVAEFLNKHKYLQKYVKAITSGSKTVLTTFKEILIPLKTNPLIIISFPDFSIQKCNSAQKELSDVIDGCYLKFDKVILSSKTIRNVLKNNYIGLWGLDRESLETLEKIEMLGIDYIF